LSINLLLGLGEMFIFTLSYTDNLWRSNCFRRG